MTQHTAQQLTIDGLGITQDELELFINNLPDTEAGLPGFEVNNIPVEIQPNDWQFVDEQIFGNIPEPEPMIVGGFGVENTETVREYEAFGVKLNDADDVISVSIVLLVVGLIYIGKSCIDYWFASRLERFKKRIEKE